MNLSSIYSQLIQGVAKIPWGILLVTPIALESVFSYTSANNLNIEYAKQHLAKERQQMTVRVGGPEIYGSGIIVRAIRHDLLLIATAAHVLPEHRQVACVSFHDGVHVPAKIIRLSPAKPADVAFLLTQTGRSSAYPIAETIIPKDMQPFKRIIAVGYPADSSYVETRGHLSRVLTRTLLGEYRVAYTNEIYKGMSGGGVFTDNNRLIGMNAVHSSPLWNAPSYYSDGGVVPANEASLLETFALGISAETIDLEIMRLGKSQLELGYIQKTWKDQRMCT